MSTPTAQLLAIVATQGDTAVETATRALAIAATAHLGQLRKSRDPYITHPIAVATCVADLNADVDTIVAALLHDVPFDTDYPFTAIHTEFGDRVYDLIEDPRTTRSRRDTAAADRTRRSVRAAHKDRRPPA